MTRDSATSSPAADRRCAAAAAALLFVAVSAASGQSAKCNRAQAIVDEVKTLGADSTAGHRAALAKLETAKTLCPSLGEIWKLARCSALALGDQGKADFYSKRAALSGVRVLDCDAPGPEPAAGAMVSRSRPLPGYVRQKFALVIGVGRFADPKIPTLSYTAKDAVDFADVLVQHANFTRSNIRLLTDEAASRASILNGLQELVLKAREDDLVVLYVSSHGSPHKAGQGLGGIGYIVTHDTQLDNIWVDAIEYEDFASKTALIKARRMVAFLDTCYSGQAFAGGGAKQLAIEGVGIGRQTAEMFLSAEGAYVVTSSRDDERSWESDRLRNSYFTYHLIEALKRGPEPPTIRQVFDELSYRVTRAVAQDKGVGQHPQIHPADRIEDVRIGVLPRLNLESEDR